MSRIWFEREIDPAPLAARRIGVIGFGSQGHAHAQNLADRGLAVKVGLRPGSSSEAAARSAGFLPEPPEAVARWADFLILLCPDEVMGPLYAEAIAPALGPGKTLAFAHGFAIRFATIVPPPEVDVVMISPIGPGAQVRSRFREGSGVPAMIAIHQDASGHALNDTLAYGHALGAARVALLETTFREECECDLFGEQTVVCGGLSELISAAFETLTRRGYPAEVAYFECAHQVRMLAELIEQRGIHGMLRGISGTAKYGALTRGPRVIDDHVRAEMDQILTEVQDGTFAARWLAEVAAGKPELNQRLADRQNHPIEKVGARLRALLAGEASSPPGEST